MLGALLLVLVLDEELAVVWEDVEELGGLAAVDEELDVPLPQPATTRATTTSAAPRRRRLDLEQGFMVL